MMVAEAAGPKERRKFERMAMRIPVIHQIPGKERLGDIFTVDVSASGLQGLVNRNFKPNQQLKLWLDFPQRESPFQTKGRVVWTRRKNDDTWRVGIEFDEIELLGLQEITENY